MIYCFDLDDTICYPNHDAKTTHEKYALATPNEEVISAINKLKVGNTIIIYTARRMLTHNGDLDKIYKDVGKVTVDWLKKHNVPYDDIIFGKPYADVYIDDKALNADDVSTLLFDSDTV
jgi:capsule biosynthesis phosphatase